MQHELSLIRKASQVEVPLEMIRSRKNQGAAFTLAVTASGREDKEICFDLGIDAGTFSRMKDGKNTLWLRNQERVFQLSKRMDQKQ